MEVHARIPAALRDVSGGRSTVTLVLSDSATVAELLDAVATSHPALERRIRDERGALRVHVNLFVGEENIRDLAGAGTELTDGAEVSILAAVSGG